MEQQNCGKAHGSSPDNRTAHRDRLHQQTFRTEAKEVEEEILLLSARFRLLSRSE
jgi:hypothetical protein